MSTRRPIPDETQHRVLDRSRRRCALCVHFDRDHGQKEGQIAHIDRDPSNAAEDNLVYLCLPHHDDYDTKRRQTKNLTLREAKTARDRLYEFIERSGDLPAGTQRPTGIEADRRTLAEIQAAMRKVPDYFLSHPNFGGCSFSLHEIEAFRAVVERRNKPEHEFID
jgi:DNA mismatch repair ATPase MutS